MQRKAVLVAAAAGGISLATFVGLSSGSIAGSSSSPPTTSGPAIAVAPTSESAAPTVSGRAVAGALPAGTAVRGTRVVKAGSADYEQVDADGVDGAYEVTVYNRFDPGELDGSGMKRSALPGGVIWIGSDGAESASIYFLSSDGVGLRIGHRPAAGRATSIPHLQDMAQRLASLVAQGRS